MVKYFYDKYNTVSTTRWAELPTWLVDTNNATIVFANYYKNYSFNTATNKFTVSNKWDGEEIVSQGSYGYYLYEYGVYRIQANASAQAKTIFITDLLYKTTFNSVQETIYSRGTLVQSNIIAENGTYPNNGRHTDGFWYVRGTVSNQNPTITPTTIPSGSLSVKPSFTYRVTDPDGNAMTVTESIDGVVFNTRTNVVSGTQLTFTPTDLAWLRTRIKQTVNVTITANDGNGGVTTVNYPITRTTPAIDLQLKTSFETNVAARRILLQLDGNIPSDAVVNVQVCNNAFDATPTWENATNLVLRKLPYLFNNTTKTATKWGVSFKVRIERGGSTQPIYLDGLGGAFD